MLTEAHPKHPDEPGEKRHPEPGPLFDLTQCEQTEVKAGDAGGEVQQRRSCQRGVHGARRRRQLPDEPDQRQNDQPAWRRDFDSGERRAGNHQSRQHPVAPRDRPGIEDEFPNTVRGLYKPVQDYRVAKFEQRQTEPRARQAGEGFRSGAFTGRLA